MVNHSMLSFCAGFVSGAMVLVLHYDSSQNGRNPSFRNYKSVKKHAGIEYTASQVNASIVTKAKTSPIPDTTKPLLGTALTQDQCSNNNTGELMKALQNERKYTLQSACRRWNRQFTGFTKQPNLNALYSTKYEFATCDIFKCGYTSWLEAVMVFEGFFNEQDYLNEKIRGDEVMNMANQNARVGSKRSREQVQQVWDNASLKIITVRNPFSRLVSAYNDKMKPDSPGFTSTYGPLSKLINKLFRHARRNSFDRNRTDDGGTATFEDFLNYLLATKEKDGHWEFFNTTCNPCVHRYTHIMKFETFREDVSYLSDALNLNEKDKRVFFPKRDFKSNFAKVEEHFAKIPKDLSRKVYEHYKMDFELFGYEKPHWIE